MECPEGRRLFDKLRVGDVLVVRWVDRLDRELRGCVLRSGCSVTRSDAVRRVNIAERTHPLGPQEVIRAAGLRDQLAFTSFRCGGFTEAAESDLSDAEMRE